MRHQKIFSVFYLFFLVGMSLFGKNMLRRDSNRKILSFGYFWYLLSPFVAGLDSPYMNLDERLASALNWALMPLIALTMILVRFSRGNLLWVLRFSCLGTIIAVGEAFYSWSGSYPS